MEEKSVIWCINCTQIDSKQLTAKEWCSGQIQISSSQHTILDLNSAIMGWTSLRSVVQTVEYMFTDMVMECIRCISIDVRGVGGWWR